MASRRQRIYHDPLHGAIALQFEDPLEATLIRLIDTPPFQRLRRICQLGPASLTFHGAEASRFTHSLGVMQVARRAFAPIAANWPELAVHRPALLCAALLHDIGHTAFSHTGEEIFHCQHEPWTARLIAEDSPIRQALAAYDPALPEQVLAVYRKQYQPLLISRLITSQLDCDRLDYLLRDSYFSGASYGRLDLDRILSALRFDSESGELAVAEKGLAAIEHYLVVRSFMYSQVYNHPKNIVAGWMLVRIFEQARQLWHHQARSLFVDPLLQPWFERSVADLSLDEYLAVDDIVCLYHLQRWQDSTDPLLADLCRRYRDRDLLKALNLRDLPTEQQQTLLEHSRQLMRSQGQDPNGYTGLCQTQSRGYTLYQSGIRLATDQGLLEISQRSPLIRALLEPPSQAWLIYPRAIEAPLKQQWQAIQSV